MGDLVGITFVNTAPTRGERLFAGVLDAVLAGLVGVVSLVVTSWFLMPFAENTDQRSAITIPGTGSLSISQVELPGWAWVVLAVVPPVAVLAFLAVPALHKGRTFGKQLAHLRLVNGADGEVAVAWRVLAKYGLMVAAGALVPRYGWLVVALGWAVSLVRADRRSAFDLVAGTAVAARAVRETEAAV